MKITRWPPRAQLAVGLLLTGLLAALPFILLRAARADRRRACRTGQPRHRSLQFLSHGALLGTLLAFIDALLIEPFRLTVTRITFPLPAVPAGRRLRLVHLSDLHISRRTRLHRRLIDAVAAERPDVIAITGDLLRDTADPAAARTLFNALSDIAPTVMILGNHERMPPLVSRRWALLRNESCALTLNDVPVRVIGWEMSDAWQPPELGMDPARVNIVLTHSPDWFPAAARQGADLALAGHTHGGQVRLPGWGAVLTNSRFGKRFEYGAYRVGPMYAFVTRGIGHEPWPLPIRFRCPPEIAVITLEHGK